MFVSGSQSFDSGGPDVGGADSVDAEPQRDSDTAPPHDASVDSAAADARSDVDDVATDAAPPEDTLGPDTRDGKDIDAGPTTPTGVSATRGTETAHVEVTWQGVQGADGYAIYRDGSKVGSVGGNEASYTDGGADAGLPAAPTNVSATKGRHTGKVVVSWDAASTTAGTRHDYRVSAIFGSTEGPKSAVATGWRQGAAVSGYEVQVDAGAWQSVGAMTSWEHTGAPQGSISAGSVDASDGAHAGYVQLTLKNASKNTTSVDYRVRAQSAAGASNASPTVSGHRKVGALSYNWQRSAGTMNQSYSGIATTGMSSYQDTGAPSDGSKRYYRCEISAPGAPTATSSADSGFRNASGFSFTPYTYENTSNYTGLSSGGVYDIADDGNGTHYIATGNGLTVYDGSSWTMYTHRNSGLPRGGVFGVEVESSTEIWMATSGGLVEYNGANSWSLHQPSPTRAFASLAVDGTGKVWLGPIQNRGRDVYRFDPSNSTWKKFSHQTIGINLPNMHIQEIVVDSKDEIWIATGFGLAHYNGTSWSLYDDTNSKLETEDVQSLSLDSTGKLWIGCLKGSVTTLDKARTTWKSFKGTNGPTSVYEIDHDSADTPYLSDNGVGFTILESNPMKWVTLSRGQSPLLGTPVGAMTIDDSDVAWMGFTNNHPGLSRYDRSKPSGSRWTNKRLNDKVLAGNIVYDIEVASNGNLWFAADNGASRWNGTSWKTFNKRNSQLKFDLATPERGVAAVHEDSSGTLWFGSKSGIEGVSRWDGSSWLPVFRKFNSGLADNNVSGITETPSGTIWFAHKEDRQYGLSRYDGSSWSTYSASGKLVSNEVETMAVGQNGDLWVGTDKGISRYDGQSWSSVTTSNSALGSNLVEDIAVDSNGTVWIATQGGLYEFHGTDVTKQSDWTVYGNFSPLPYADVREVAVSGGGSNVYLWVARSRFELIPGRLTTAGTGSWTKFTYPTLESSDVNSHEIAVGPQGDVWFANNNGVGRVDTSP